MLSHLIAPLWRGVFKMFTQAGNSNFRMHERGWARVSELETEIRLLRTALSRTQTRGSAYSTALEVCLSAMPLPLEDRIRTVKQARMILESSFSGSSGGIGK